MAVDELLVSYRAWCAPADRVEAFMVALSALAMPGYPWRFALSNAGSGAGVSGRMSMEQIQVAARLRFQSRTEMEVGCRCALPSGVLADCDLWCFGDDAPSHDPPWSLSGFADVRTVERLRIPAHGGAPALQDEAAAAAFPMMQDVEGILLRLSSPTASYVREATIAQTAVGSAPPIEKSGSYMRSVEEIARDLVSTWVYLHDGDHLASIARIPLTALFSRVEAAPPGARVGVAMDVRHAGEHLGRERDAEHDRSERARRPNAVRSVPRAFLPGDVVLTREQVLAAIATKPATLLEALEAAAVPDEEWREAEPRAKELLALGDDVAAVEVDVATGRHKRWIEQHAPFHVQRTPNGGVMLTTHPYRTLWPLWADALALLGIRDADNGPE